MHGGLHSARPVCLDTMNDSRHPAPPTRHFPAGRAVLARRRPAAGDRAPDRRASRAGLAHQTLLGVTGSGKTYTIANVIQAVQKPTLVMAPNKTLAAQLYGEFKAFFPHNAVEYFVSYYDYYQPEAYVPSSATPSSRRTARSTSTSSRCACRRPRRCWSAATRSSSAPCRRSTAWATRTNTSAWCCTWCAASASTSAS